MSNATETPTEGRQEMPAKRGRPSRSRVFPSKEAEEGYGELEAKGLRPADIYRELVRRHGQYGAPAKRNVERYVEQDRSSDQSGPWRLWMTEPEDVPVVFETLSVVIATTEGQTRWLTATEAKWVVRVHKMGVNEPFSRFLAARQFARSRDQDHTVDLVFATVRSDFLPDDVPGMPSPGQSLREWMDNGPRRD